MPAFQTLAWIVLIGLGATAVLDVWLLLLKRLGVPAGSFALVGRWVGHVARGRLSHPSISKADPLPNELAIGWTVHYAVGVSFAAMLVSIQGPAWIRQPTLLPALLVGAATVVMPLFVMQPAMGSGFAASKTPTPLRNCLRSLANHAVFGLGMYLTAVALAHAMRRSF